MICQIAIIILGVISVFLSMEMSLEKRKWAPVVGLAAQPFWFYETFLMSAWGMLGLSIIYTLIMIRAIYNYWFTMDVK